MSKYYIYQDAKRCIGCFSCESHCKTKNNLPIGPRLSQIIPVGPKKLNNLPRMSYVFMPCFHCQEPWCVAACPTGAMQKRPKDGIVFVHFCARGLSGDKRTERARFVQCHSDSLGIKKAPRVRSRRAFFQ